MLLGVALIAIIIIFMGIKNEIKVVKALEFTKENIVAAWTYNNEDHLHDYDYNISEEDANTISHELTKGNLKRGSIKEMSQNDTKEVTILLDGAKKEHNDGTSYSYEVKLYIKNIDEKKAYIYLELNDISDDVSSMIQIMERHYTIESKKIVDTINNLYN